MSSSWKDASWDDVESERVRAERTGRRQVYNSLISMYLDEKQARGQSLERPYYNRDQRKRDQGHGEALVWAAMITFGIDETAATERVAEDLEERWADRAD